MRAFNLHIKNDQMRKRIDTNQTHVIIWVHDEVLQTSVPLLYVIGLKIMYARQQIYNLDIYWYAQTDKSSIEFHFLPFAGPFAITTGTKKFLIFFQYLTTLATTTKQMF